METSPVGGVVQHVRNGQRPPPAEVIAGKETRETHCLNQPFCHTYSTQKNGANNIFKEETRQGDLPPSGVIEVK